MVKRVFDLLVASLGLLLLSPLFAILILALKIASPGPAFYLATRVGRNGRNFRAIKIRTMVVDADRVGPSITTAGDSRITAMGKFFRRTKLDELPQLINVIKGDMSLVGPRPEAPKYVAMYTPEQRAVLRHRPGMTSLASLQFRNEEEELSGPRWEELYVNEIMPEKLRIDLAYLEHRTFLTDLKVIWGTVALAPIMIEMMKVFRPVSQFLVHLRNRHLFVLDIVLLPLAAVVAFALRLDASAIRLVTRVLLIFAVAAPLIKIPIFARLGLYWRYWQYAGQDEMMLLVWAAAIGALAQGALFLSIQAFVPDLFVPGVPRSIPFIDLLVTFAVIAAPRFALRAGATSAQRVGNAGPKNDAVQRVLIAGAGEAGATVLRELRQNPKMGLLPVGFIDDDSGKHGMLLNGVPVLGDRKAIPDLVRSQLIDEVIIALPGAAGKTIREVMETCEAAGVSARIVPDIYELLNGTTHLNRLRGVQIDDLLRRETVHTDIARVEALLRGKRVLVTGAGGSIGSELCRQILRCHPASLVLLGHGENSIFDIYHELRTEMTRPGTSWLGTMRPTLIPVIADIRFSERLKAVFAEHRPEIVFHAAAHKHVPLMEDNISDAITNNVLGTLRVVEACASVGVARFVLISTDKAVNPTSIMGATKRAAELIVQRAARSSQRAYCAVRFGNVLGSRGSVVPFFQKQIAAGGPVTVTHPEVRRFFMTIPEAVQLVLQAATMGRGGEIFMLDMGEPVRILDLARDLIRLSGLQPERDIKIAFVGLRPGEKLYEELSGSTENYSRTDHLKVLRFQGDLSDRDAEVTDDALRIRLESLFDAADCQDDESMRLALRSLVPEYMGPTGVAA